MKHVLTGCALCSLVVLLFACTPKAACDSATQDPEQIEAPGPSALEEEAELHRRYEELGQRLQEERQRIAQRNPDFDLAGFVEKTENALEPPFKHDRVTAPLRRRVAGRYVQTRITFVYHNRDIAHVVKYLQAIENPEHGVRVSAIKLISNGQMEKAPVAMAITLSVVTERARMAVDVDKEGDEHPAENEDVPDNAAPVEALTRMLDARAAELAALVGENSQKTLDVLRELSRICQGGKLPSEQAEEPADEAADMAPLLKPSGPWQVRITEFEMTRGHVRIEGSATNYAGVNHLRRALEASPLIKKVDFRGSRRVGERTTLRMRLYLGETPHAD